MTANTSISETKVKQWSEPDKRKFTSYREEIYVAGDPDY